MFKDDISYMGYKLFEYRESQEKGVGYRFTLSGNSYNYKWAYPKIERDVMMGDI